MGEATGISWTDRTWSPWEGCTKVSPACDFCYAEHMSDHRFGRVIWGKPGDQGTRRRMSEGYWRQPLVWQRNAKHWGIRPFVFPSLCDPFDNQVPALWREQWFELIRATPDLVWLLLTKRPQNIVKQVKAAGGLPPNVALGTTVEDRPRLPNLVSLLTAQMELHPLFAFASFEPLLEGLGDISGMLRHQGDRFGLGWCITGGETDQGQGKTARVTHPDWVRSIRDQCATAGVPYHHKQWGEWHAPTALSRTVGLSPMPMVRVGAKRSGRMLDGVIHDARPALPARGL